MNIVVIGIDLFVMVLMLWFIVREMFVIVLIILIGIFMEFFVLLFLRIENSFESSKLCNGWKFWFLECEVSCFVCICGDVMLWLS